MTTEQPRQPAGSPEGGQYAAVAGSESGVTLIALDSSDVASIGSTLVDHGEKAAASELAQRLASDSGRGDANVSVGSRTPWGEAQQVEQIGNGIARVDTASHGGYKLSADNNREVPEPLRRPGGWYEEDCEAYIVLRTFPTAPGFTTGGMTPDQVLRAGEDGTKRWFGREWAAVTGNPVPQETLDQEERHADADARHQAEREALADAPRYRVTDVDLGKISSARTRQTVTRDLDQLWRDKDGAVRSLREILATDGVSGRQSQYTCDGKYTYALVQHDKVGDSDYTYMRVSKATFEALGSDVPDITSDSDRLFGEARAAHDQMRSIERSLALNDQARRRANHSEALEREHRRLSKALTAAQQRWRDAETAVDEWGQRVD